MDIQDLGILNRRWHKLEQGKTASPLRETQWILYLLPVLALALASMDLGLPTRVENTRIFWGSVGGGFFVPGKAVRNRQQQKSDIPVTGKYYESVIVSSTPEQHIKTFAVAQRTPR